MWVSVARALATGADRIRPFMGFWRSNVPQMRDSLPWTPMNCRAKFDAASFILGRQIRNRTNTLKKQ